MSDQFDPTSPPIIVPDTIIWNKPDEYGYCIECGEYIGNYQPPPCSCNQHRLPLSDDELRLITLIHNIT